MAEKQPAILLYTGDWKKDTALAKCSLATRGAWIEMLFAMHDNGRTGTLTGTLRELAQICRCSEDEVLKTLKELKRSLSAHVTFGRKNVTVTNRRMQREHKLRQGSKLRVRRHREEHRKEEMLRDCNAPSSSSSSSSIQKEELLLGNTSDENKINRVVERIIANRDLNAAKGGGS